MRIATIKPQVETILREFPDSRDSDLRLTALVYVTFYANRLERRDGKWYIPFSSWKYLPRETTIVRIRASFQNDIGAYLPTTEEVAKKRHLFDRYYKNTMPTLVRNQQNLLGESTVGPNNISTSHLSSQNT